MARPRSSNRSQAGLVFQLRRPSARMSSGSVRTSCRPRRDRVAVGAGSRDSRQSRRPATLHRLVRRAGGPAVGISTTTSSSPCSTICSGSRPEADARAPDPMATACSLSTSTAATSSSARSRRAARASNRAGCVNFNYFIDDDVLDFIVDAVLFVARNGWKFLGDYRFDSTTGLWHHRAGPVEPPLRLADISCRGSMTHPPSPRDGPGERARDHLARRRHWPSGPECLTWPGAPAGRAIWRICAGSNCLRPAFGAEPREGTTPATA